MKKLFLVMPAVLLAVFMATSCSHALNSEQQKAYDSYIEALAGSCALVEISADTVASGLKEFNATAKKTHGFIIEDTQAGQPIARGTSKEDLKKRFKPKNV